ncbi:VOC family protein [Acaryochloris marina]|uniref:VOC family protein n=1 Tax=Acaryochloris marina TaxID=155978 RepID=UPI002017CF11|nr:VOC family protein [Acaryochloris marina]
MNKFIASPIRGENTLFFPKARELHRENSADFMSLDQASVMHTDTIDTGGMTHLPHPTASPNHFSGLAPILNVSNIPRSIDFYVNLLGFQQDWAWGDPPTFASVSRDDVCIFLCQGAQGQSGMWLSIFVHDVDALYAMYKDKDVNIR